MGETVRIPPKPQIPSLDRYLGCVLGGALGDALGYAVEFDHLGSIIAQFGEGGIRSPQLDLISGKALISDDTQMSIFTIDGILTNVCNDMGWEINQGLTRVMMKSYLKWLYTQTNDERVEPQYENWEPINKLNYDLYSVSELFNRRAPGNTCLSALYERASDEHANLSNTSKGCGGVMRVAPIGLYLYNNHDSAYRYGKETAAITHRHTTSDQSSGALASIIALIVSGKSVRQAVRQTLSILGKELGSNKETVEALRCAVAFADNKNMAVRDAISKLGEGWVAEEALAIAVYCALKAKNYSEGVIYAVNHSGDSDSTGAICGNILGTLYGYGTLPRDWLAKLELRDFLEYLTRILHKAATIKAIRFAGQKENEAEFTDMFRSQ
jgi:ADP-ribosylglycohydrolase